MRTGAYARAIHNLDASVEVFGCPAPSFVEIVERELATGAHLQERWLEDGDIFDTPEIRDEVARTLSPIIMTDVDTVVLGCTHFPLLARRFARHWEKECAWCLLRRRRRASSRIS